MKLSLHIDILTASDKTTLDGVDIALEFTPTELVELINTDQLTTLIKELTS